MYYDEQQPLMVQSDGTILVEVDHKEYPIIQPTLAQIADLVHCPEAIHSYKMTALTVWYAAAQGIMADEIISFLSRHSKFPVAEKVKQMIDKNMNRYGTLRLVRNKYGLVLTSKDDQILNKLNTTKQFKDMNVKQISPNEYVIKEECRGDLKQLCIEFGYPVHDVAGYEKGRALPISLKQSLSLRPYQMEAVTSFYQKGNNDGGSGVVVLPCGAGKTIVGIGVMATLREEVFILTPNETSMLQWKRELLNKTTLTEDDIGLYQSKSKEVKPVTIATYQMLTYRNSKTKQFQHLPLFNKRNWGLVIYDEVHLLPAPLFRTTASIQGKRRLGLTATLVREDGKAEEVFSLIGPKRYEAPWKGLENNGWIASASCKEIKIEFTKPEMEKYYSSSPQSRYRIAAENSKKLDAIKRLLELHSNRPTLIIGQYITQLEKVANEFNLPIITGTTPQKQREEYYQQFKSGEIKTLVVSKVANLAIDLPDAEIAIQISGAFGSRQEEAQRIGRLLRPNKDDSQAVFYTVITKGSKEEHFSENRQRFMIEQGYEYGVEEWSL